MTTEGLDQILADYFDGNLKADDEQQLSEYVKESEDRDYDNLCGVVISRNLIPDYDSAVCCHLSEYLDESRLNQLEDGAEPSSEELELFRAAWLHWAGHSSEADSDVIPGFVTVKVNHSDGRSCYGLLLIRGYSFTEIREEFHGLFRDGEAVLKYVRALGYIGAEVPEPSPDLVDRARASSCGRAPLPAAPHPIETLPARQFEARYLQSSGEWDRLTYGQLERLLSRSLLHYGCANNTGLIPAMTRLMYRAVRDLSPERRASVYKGVCETIERQKLLAFYALIPAVVHEPVAEIAATATIDFVSLSPPMPDGIPVGFREAVSLFRSGSPSSSGGVFGGLVSLGDERFRRDLEGLKAHLSPRDIQAAARCDTGFASDAQIRFWLDWAESLIPLAGNGGIDSIIGSVASALARIRKHAVVPTVYRCERLFPVYLYESPSRLIESWSIDEYANIIGPHLYALEADEPPPKVFSSVLEIWGLRPKAREADRRLQPLIC
jgi:hypothetical protein